MSYSGGWRPHIESARCLDLCRLFETHALQAGAETRGGWQWTRHDACTGSVSYHAKLGEASGTLTIDGKLSGKPITCTIELETLPRPYGGRIWYFRCPATGRRARKLYAWPGFAWFVHREAIRPKPTYASQRVSGHDRVADKRQALRLRLRDTGEWQYGLNKPKWMRWATFERYQALDEALEAQQDAYLLRIMARMRT